MSKLWISLMAAGVVAVCQSAVMAEEEPAAAKDAVEVKASVPAPFAWSEDFAAAQAQAKKENKLLLVDFTGSDWCGWCIRLEQQVFSKKAFQDAVVKKFVPVKIDFPQNIKQSEALSKQNAELAEKYEIEGFPTVMVMTPEGKVLFTTGYESVTPEKYVEMLEEGAVKSAAAVPGFEWLQDFDAAKAIAQKENKLLFVDFTGSDWCRWCIKLDKQILTQKEFQEYAVKKFVMLKVDFPKKAKLSAEQLEKNNALKKQYGITGYPTILVMNPDGEVVYKTGYKDLSPAEYAEHLEKGIAAAQAKEE